MKLASFSHVTYYILFIIVLTQIIYQSDRVKKMETPYSNLMSYQG